ncbi:SKA3 protein, partial [Neodrepanis coruscans]|nr:SKA3 protein [Neodrepanis coruscans]
DYEDESPVGVLQDLHSEVRTLKEHVNASLGKSCSEKQAVHEFMKASEILMQRNAADLGKLRELFLKYDYKPLEEVNSDSTVSVQNKSDEEKANDVLHLPACTEKPPLPKDPQLSDFGLSQYAFSRPWSAVKAQHTTNANQQKSKNETPLKVQTPRTLPKTPKCKLKMDDYECVTPRLEHFGISEHTVCMNEDYTMSLIHKTAQTIKNKIPCCGNSVLSLTYTPPYKQFALFAPVSYCKDISRFSLFSLLRKKKLQRICKSMKSLDLPVSVSFIYVCVAMFVFLFIFHSPLISAADWMASPMVLVFCTPDVKVASKTSSTVLSRSPETKELPLPSHTATPQCPDFQTRWLKTEVKVENSNLCTFLLTFAINTSLNVSLGSFSSTVKPGGKIELVTRNDVKDKQYKEDRIPFAVSPDEYLKHLGDPSPPAIKQYDQLLDTPPPPEITRIPDDVLQILSKYNHKVDSSRAKEMETKVGNTTRYESDSTDYRNKENRYGCILQIWL